MGHLFPELHSRLKEIRFSVRNIFWLIVFSAINLLYSMSDRAWTTFWRVAILIASAFALPCAAWFAFGGVIDIRASLQAPEERGRGQSHGGRVIRDAEPAAMPKVRYGGAH